MLRTKRNVIVLDRSLQVFAAILTVIVATICQKCSSENHEYVNPVITLKYYNDTP